MKRLFSIILISLFWSWPARPQSFEVQQLLLNVEKLSQFKKILSDMKKGYQLISQGYNQIKGISEGNFSLHQVFLEGLLKVNPVVREYRRIPLIIRHQLAISKTFHRAFKRIAKAPLRPDELSYIQKVYERLLSGSLKNLEELLLILTSGELRMSDAQRLSEIDRIYSEVEDRYLFIKSFMDQQLLLAMQKQKEQLALQRLRSLLTDE